MLKNLLGLTGKGRLPRGAVFLSGNGSNAEKVLEYREKTAAAWQPVVIITDAPETSRAAEIAGKYKLPLAAVFAGQ